MSRAKFQKLFDQSVAFLTAQGRGAVGGRGACVYMAGDGRKCGVGCLLSQSELDGLKSAGLNYGSAWSCLPEDFKGLVWERLGMKPGSESEGFMRGLQRMHDTAVDVEGQHADAAMYYGDPDPVGWVEVLAIEAKVFANEYHLSTKRLDASVRKAGAL